MQWTRDPYRIVDGASAVDAEAVSRLLGATYWGSRRPRGIIDKLIAHSLCFSLLLEDAQVGFARVVTDYTVFSWLSDLVIAQQHRSKGLGLWLLDCVLEHPDIAHTQFVLQTGEARALYERFGFRMSERLMSRAAAQG